MAIISGLPTKINALQCEWFLKHPENKKRTNRRFCGTVGRIMGLNLVLKSEKWTNNSTIYNKDMKLKVWILEKYTHLLNQLPKNIEVFPVDIIDPKKLIN